MDKMEKKIKAQRFLIDTQRAVITKLEAEIAKFKTAPVEGMTENPDPPPITKYPALNNHEKSKDIVFEVARQAIGKYDINAPPLTKNRFANEFVESLEQALKGE